MGKHQVHENDLDSKYCIVRFLLGKYVDLMVEKLVGKLVELLDEILVGQHVVVYEHVVEDYIEPKTRDAKDFELSNGECAP